MQGIYKVLRQYFGFSDFREPQQAVVDSILEGNDTLVIMPTGGGKSLCYQLPALVMEGTTLVISPLIALMKDQVDALQTKGIAAAMINSSQSWQEQKAILEQMRREQLKLVYVSPERFRAGSFVNALKGVRIAMLAIDEAHCISQWGHDFRPDYLRIGKILNELGRPRCSAFTATATPDVREDIERQLQFVNPTVFVSGFARSNLSFNITEVNSRAQKFKRILALIKAHDTGIIYCATRKSVEAVSEELLSRGIPHCAYHAGLSPHGRKAAQDQFMQKNVPIAVATSAFGMGIDRADIRFVCHYEMPGSVEAFYQEAGRAGRDRKPAHCEMLFMYADKRVQDFFTDGANPDARFIREVYAQLRSVADAQNEVTLLIDEITEQLPGKNNPMATQTALSHLIRGGYIERFDIPGKLSRGTRLLQPEVKAAQLELPEADLREKKSRDESKLKAVIQMAYTKECRQSWILRYFGEVTSGDCNRCDNCTHDSAARPLSADEQITVRKALSGIARMSQRISRHQWQARYGRTRIIQCLAGRATAKLTEAGLEQLSTFGILSNWHSKHIGLLLDAMEQAALLQTEHAEYPLLGLTELGSQVMYEETVVPLEWPQLDSTDTTTPSRKRKSASANIDSADEDLYKKLVALRNQMRQARGTPAYTIFPNTVLQQLATHKPATAEAAMQIKGIGPVKAASILPEFLKLINKA